MRLRLLFLALLVLLPAGCRGSVEEEPLPHPQTPQELLAEQPIDEYHDAFLVDTGGRMGTLLVTVEKGTEKGEFEYSMYLSVWDPADMTRPMQTFESVTTIFGAETILDVNFDGYPDFTYLYWQGLQATAEHCWLWDEEQGLFVEVPEYTNIYSPYVRPEKQIIVGWNRSSGAGDGVETFHKWVDGDLVCVRRIEVRPEGIDHDSPFRLTVEDRIDGELTEVFRAYFPPESEGYFEESSKWADLDYHGDTTLNEKGD